jgi:FkbM family methyltransferase
MIERLYDVLFFRPPEAALQIPDVGAMSMALHEKGDRWISDVIRRGEVFDAHIFSVLRDLAVPSTTLIDVGANIGWFTVIGSRLVGNDGHIYAVEPCARNLRLLHRNVVRNRCANVTILACAAGAETGAARLFRSADNQGDHRLEITSDRPDSVEVPILPLDALLAKERKRTSVVKIDTQGSESAVLRGMRGLLAVQPQIRVVLEFWPYGLERCGSSVAELADILNERPNSLWLLHADGTTEETSPEAVNELGAIRFAPATEAHADLVWLASDDRQAIASMQRRNITIPNPACLP